MFSHQCDRLYMAVDQFHWYKLAKHDRLKYILILKRLQNPTLLMCGTLKINMELFVTVSFCAYLMKSFVNYSYTSYQVMKNTYTVAMLLNEMSE